MTVYRRFGEGTGDVLIDSTGRPRAGFRGTVWTARTGGTQIVDLLDRDGNAINYVTTQSDGSYPFQAPNTQPSALWLDFGGSNRVSTTAVDLPNRFDTLEGSGGFSGVPNNGTVTDAKVAVGAAIQTSKIAGLDAALAAKAVDSTVVHNTGTETIAGTKTFSGTVNVPTPSSAAHAVNKSYADSLGGTVVHITGTETVTGDKTFSGQVNVPTPTASGHAATKAYVDAIPNLVNAKGDILAGSADNTLVRVPAAANGRAITYDSTTASGLSSAVIPDVSGKADKSGTLGQFADVDDAAPSDGDILRYDDTSNEYFPVDLTTSFAALDSNGRIVPSANPQYYLPGIVINEGDTVPADFPAGGVVYVVPASGTSLVPVAIGNDTSVASTTCTITTTAAVAVGEYLVLGLFASAEAGAPITATVTYGAGVCPMTPVADHTQGSTIQTQLLYGRCTTTIPSGTVITVTVSSSRAEVGVQACKVAGLVTSSALDQSGTGGASSGFSYTAGPTGSTGQASEVAFAMFGFNPGGTSPTRTLAGTGGWAAVSATLQANGASQRSGLMLYKVLTSVGTVTATATLTGPDASVWSGSVATLKAV